MPPTRARAEALRTAAAQLEAGEALVARVATKEDAEVIAQTLVLTTVLTAALQEAVAKVARVARKAARVARAKATVVPSAGLRSGQKTFEVPASARTTISATNASRLAARTPTIAQSSARMASCAMPLPGPTSPRTAHFCD